MLSPAQTAIIREVLRPYNPSLIGVFGSYARSNHQPGSDIDLLVEIDEKFNLLDLIGIEQQLSEMLKTKIDLVTLRSLNLKIRTHVLNDLIRITE